MTAIDELGEVPSDFRGIFLRPGDADFDDARRLFSGRAADRIPLAIARCTDANDVAAIVRWSGGRNGIPLAVRGGGHNTDGCAVAHDRLVIDLSLMRGITVEPDTRVVRAEPGVLLGEIDAAAQQHGLVVPSGTNSVTGVAGLTLGGGVGHLMRRFGATVDNLLACEVVTADGRQVRADATNNPDLFWALRGGGGNFGIVTSFEYRAHPVGPDVVSGMIFFGIDDAADVLRRLATLMETAPRELSVLVTLTSAPPETPVDHVLAMFVVYSGDLSRADDAVSSIAALGNPMLNDVTKRTWLETNSMIDELAPWGTRVAQRGGYIAALSDDVIDASVDQLLRAPRRPDMRSTGINFYCMKGAITEDFDADSTAFPRQGAGWLWELIAIFDSPDSDSDYDRWANDTVESLQPLSLPETYINLTQDRGPEWLRNAYGGDVRFRRLREIKSVWDPNNRFRFNKNIPPVHIVERVIEAQCNQSPGTDLFAPDAVSWHSFDEVEVPMLPTGLQAMRAVRSLVPDFDLTDLRTFPVVDGVAWARYVVVGTLPDGSTFRAPAALAVHVGESGKVTRLEEYVDSAQVVGLLAAMSSMPSDAERPEATTQPA
ncbi:FAD-binding protein [Mycobacterium sp. DBP42]|uniref:FAD-binding protein n=1 Tax=Mycobacterium sp. DBP42 TaxID=2545267 RepID=UPI00110CCFB9|nr:FAD-binding protein [Mycobacterium sp. DBP42]TMS51182.1 FAD-binding protein [Mycobacterium sp. DBP42]